jgi:hypothetical protein
MMIMEKETEQNPVSAGLVSGMDYLKVEKLEIRNRAEKCEKEPA